MLCELCKRDVPALTRHHLVPVTRGTDGVVVMVCGDCHSAIHKFFSNKELERAYNTLDKLMEHEGFARHVRWLSKRPPQDKFKTILTRGQRGRGRNG